jgi:hypothetical protein
MKKTKNFKKKRKNKTFKGGSNQKKEKIKHLKVVLINQKNSYK